jgi:polar amino acid transport system substrate-binding protein
VKLVTLSTFLFFFAATNLPAEVVYMAFGEKLPPFINPQDQSGIELEIVREALAFKDHILKPKFLPMARLPVAYKNKSVNSLMMDVGERITEPNGFYGDVPVLYRNAFITLKKKKIKISCPSDLDGKIINGFIGASKRYPEWLGKVTSAKTYFEINDQSLQVLQLLHGRIDAVLSDVYIFKYYFFQENKKFLIQFSDFDVHYVLKENPLEYRPVFRSKLVRDDFNLGLKHLQKTGKIQKIYNKYIKED